MVLTPEERRKRRSEVARRTKPWLKSTGPKTEAGKKKVSQNAYKHGAFSQETLQYFEDVVKTIDFLIDLAGEQNL